MGLFVSQESRVHEFKKAAAEPGGSLLVCSSYVELILLCTVNFYEINLRPV